MELEQMANFKAADGRVRLRKAINNVTPGVSRGKDEINRRLIRAHSGTTRTLVTVDEEKEESKDLEAQSIGGRVNAREIV
jgi:hypothetical protein